jgi:hypothetical protein
MREVGVHLDDAVRAELEGSRDARAIGGAEALFGGAVEDVDAGIRGGEGVRDPAGAVGRIVVDDEHLELRRLLEDRRDDERQVLGFVVCRKDDHRPAHGRLRARE